MQLISHRGAKGLGPENTLESIRAAAELHVDYIEFDVQCTKDNQPVVFHNLYTKSGSTVSELTLSEFRIQHPSAPLLKDALVACGASTPLVELKAAGTAKVSVKVLSDHPKACVTSFMSQEITLLTQNLAKRERYMMQRKHPMGIIGKAKKAGSTGIGINKNWALLLPHFYWHGRRNNLTIYAYTVNSVLLAKVLIYFMPHLLICTDYPNRLQGN